MLSEAPSDYQNYILHLKCLDRVLMVAGFVEESPEFQRILRENQKRTQKRKSSDPVYSVNQYLAK